MRRGKSDWLLIAIGGLLGALFGLATAYFTMWADGPNLIECHPVNAVLTYSEQPGTDARLDVEVRGYWRYSRTAAHRSDLQAEFDTLGWFNLAPGLAVIGVGFALGVQAGAMAGRRARRKRAAILANPTPS
jgi:hypothetical protein